MSLITESPPSSSKTDRTSIVDPIDDLTSIADGNNKPLVIILAVTLPTLACIGILILLIICYRRRHTTISLKKLESSNRLQGIVVNLSTSSVQPQYSEKKVRLSNRQYLQPRTETIVYNRLSTPSTPLVCSPFNDVKSLIKGETNAAFDEYSIQNEQQPILRSTLQQSSNTRQHTTTLQTDFPPSLQAPVRTITSALVDAIAAHRLSLPINSNSASLETSTTTSTSNNSSHSGASSSGSNTSQTVLLFSQRTEF